MAPRRGPALTGLVLLLLLSAGGVSRGLHLTIAGAGLDGSVTGDSTAFAFAPMLGYRIVF